LIADAILHVAGIGFAVTGLALLISMADRLPGFQGTSVWIYGLGLVTVVATSTAYNAWPLGSTKLLLRRFDSEQHFPHRHLDIGLPRTCIEARVSL
jgi:hemolysin III